MLQDKAMLIDVTLSSYTPHKKSRNVQHAAAQSLGVDEGYIIGSKRLASKDHFKALTNHDGKIRKVLYTYTRPWLDNSWRILPSQLYFDVTDSLRDLFSERENLVSDLAKNWPSIKEESRIALNGEYDESDFPDDISKCYSHSISFMPIPRTGDFRAPEGLDEDDIAQIEASTMQKIEEQFSSRDLWQRIRNELVTDKGTVGDRLRSYGTDDEGKVVNKFHDTLITNIRDLMAVLPKLNIAGDPAIDEIKDMIESTVCAYDPATLRENDNARKLVADTADQILSVVSSFMA